MGETIMDKKMTLGDMVALDIIKRPLIPSKEHRLSHLGMALALDSIDRYSPLELFANGEKGVWYDPSDVSTLYQDSSGTTPVVSDGDPVGLMLDKSKGLELGQETLTNFDFINGGAGWTVTNEDGTHYVTFSNGKARYVSDTTSPVMEMRQNGVMEIGKWYVFTVVVSDYVSGSLKTDNFGAPTLIISNKGTFRFIAKATHTQFLLYRNTSNVDITIDSVSIKEIKGNHASQPTSASRPIYRRGDSRGVVNLLKWSEKFDDTIWTKQGIAGGSAPIVTANAGIAPDGTNTADRIQFSITSDDTGDRSFIRQALTPPSGNKIHSIYVKSNTGSTQYISQHNAGSTVTQLAIGTEWVRLETSDTATIPTFYGLELRGGQGSGELTSDLLVWGIQIEQGITSTKYQRNDERLGGVSGFKRGDGRGVVNLLKWSEDLTKSDWGKFSTISVTSNVDKDLLGNLTADRINNLNVGDGDVGIWQRITASPNTTYTGSMYVKGEGSNIGKNIRFRLKRNGGTFIAVNNNVTLTDKWTKVTLSITTLSDNTGVDFTITKDTSVADNQQADSVLVSFTQIELGSVSTKYQSNAGFLGGIASDVNSDIRWLDFDGVDDYMKTDISLSHPISMTTSLTIDAGADSYIFDSTQRNALSFDSFPYDHNKLKITGTSSNVITEPNLFSDYGKKQVILATLSTNSLIYRNAIKTASGTSTNVSSTDLFIGCRYSATKFLKFSAFNILITGKDFSSDERKNLEYFLAQKAGAKLPVLTPPLNIGHTYE